MSRRKSLSRKHKGGTGRSKRDRNGNGGIALHGSSPAVTAEFATPSDDLAQNSAMSAATNNSVFLPFLSVTTEKTSTAVVASVNMNRSEYGKLLVSMGNSKDRLPN